MSSALNRVLSQSHRRSTSLSASSSLSEDGGSGSGSVTSSPEKSMFMSPERSTLLRVPSLRDTGSAVLKNLKRNFGASSGEAAPPTPVEASAPPDVGSPAPPRLKTAAQLVRNTISLTYLMEFMGQHKCDDYLRFWLKMEDYRGADLRSMSNDALASDARALHAKFFESTTTPIFSHEPAIKEQLANTFKTEAQGDRLFEALFAVQKEVIVFIDGKYLKSFRESASYKHMLRELAQSSSAEPPATAGSAPSANGSGSAGPMSPLAGGSNGSEISRTPAKRMSHVNNGVRSLSLSSLPGSTPPGLQTPSVPNAAPNAIPQASTAYLPSSLRDVLLNPTMLFYFMEFMERSRMKNLVNFWMTVESYSSTSTAHDNEVDEDRVLFKDAESLYNLYFKNDAPQPIKLPKALLNELQGYVTKKPTGGSKPVASFRFEVMLRIQKEVFQMMEKRSFKPFLESSLWVDCRRELALSVARSSENVHEVSSVAGHAVHESSSSASVASSVHSGLNGSTDSLRRSRTPLSLGYLDELGFFVNDSDEVFRDMYSVQIQEQTKSALTSLLNGSNANENDPVAVRLQAKAILTDVAQSANADILKYDEADGI